MYNFVRRRNKSHVTVMVSIICTAESLTFPVQCTEGQDMDQLYFARLREPGRESGLRQITKGRPVNTEGTRMKQ